MLSDLTNREQEIAVLVGKGFTNFAIGTALKIKEGTVKIHMHHILVKLNILNRTQLALLVAKHEPQ
jgi:DNA-binding NarL/FixJ family response regulator